MSETFQRTQIDRCDKSIGEFKQLPSSLDRLKELWNGLILDIIHKDYILLYHCDSEHFPLNTREKQAFLILYYVTYIRIGNVLFHLSLLLILPSSSCSFMHICFELWLIHNGISKESSLWAWLTHFLIYWLNYYYISYSRWWHSFNINK